ncbi:MAG TPA: hypothetical protein VJ761_05905 [Ktedonobacteraceae bacterium]|nr:hypothetical protein [Ktedonobacteraceae bacterium]
MEALIIAILSAIIGGGGGVGILKLFIEPHQEKQREREVAKNTKLTHRKELCIRVLEHIRIHRTDLQDVYTIYNNRFIRASLPFNKALISLWSNKKAAQQKEIANLGSELILDLDAKEVNEAFIAWANASDAYGGFVTQPKSMFHKVDSQTLEKLDRDISEKVEAVENAVRAYLTKPV